MQLPHRTHMPPCRRPLLSFLKFAQDTESGEVPHTCCVTQVSHNLGALFVRSEDMSPHGARLWAVGGQYSTKAVRKLRSHFAL